jgi:aminoglycoside phosphotransferase (APT) family kinase protein
LPNLPPGHPLDSARLAQWLDAVAPQLGTAAPEMNRLAGGSSGAVFRISRGDGAAVLRMPVWPPRADSAQGMAREAKVLGALGSTPAPHPRLLAYDADAAAVGLPVLLMEFVDGWLGSAPPPPPFASPAGRHALAFALIDAVAQVGLVDYEQVGLGDLGRPEGFLDRQVGRWLGQLEGYKTAYRHPGRDIPDLQYVADWLRANQPATQKLALIHSDIGFPNVMFANQPPPRVAAIIDWEIATLGDPLLDLGRAIYTFPGRKAGSGKGRMHDLSDMPTREDLAGRYAEVTGLDVAPLDYYCVLSAFKLACIIEFNYFRVATGQDSSEMAQSISSYVPEIIADAAAIARSAG